MRGYGFITVHEAHEPTLALSAAMDVCCHKYVEKQVLCAEFSVMYDKYRLVLWLRFLYHTHRWNVAWFCRTWISELIYDVYCYSFVFVVGVPDVGASAACRDDSWRCVCDAGANLYDKWLFHLGGIYQPLERI